MSKTVDERVVQMKFDNRQFERGVNDTMSTLEKFKQKLDLTGASKGLDEVQKSAQNLDKNMSFNNAEKSLNSLEKRFSSLGIVGMTVIQNLTNSMMNFVKKIGDYSIGGIISGGKARAAKIENARFQIKGLLKDVEDADKRLEDIMSDVNYGVESTAYGLDAAAAVAAQLVASGMEAGEGMRHALRGISGVAAMTNSTYEEIGNIYTTIAGNGRLMSVQLLQLSSRGMNAAAILAKSLNKTEAEVRDMVSKGQISFEMFSTAMDDAFGEHAKDANKTFEGVLKNIKSALSKIGADFFTPIKTENSPLVLFLNSVRERINDLRKNLSPITKEITDKINSIITKIDTWFKKGSTHRFGFSPISDLLKPLEKAEGVFETVTETAGRFADKIREIEKRINDTMSPLNGALNVIEKINDAAINYDEIVNQIIYGTWDNGVPRYDKLTEAGINYYKAQNLVNERLGAQFRYGQDVIDQQDEMLGLNKKQVESTEGITRSEDELLETMQELDDETLKQYGLTEDQISAFRELAKVADKTGLKMSYILDMMKSGKFDTMFLIAHSFENIGSILVTIFESIGKAFAKAFELDDNGLFDLIAAFHKFTQIAKEFVDNNSENITKAFTGIFSVIHMIVKIITGAFTTALQFINKILGIFGTNVTDLAGKIGDLLYRFSQWVTDENGLIAMLKVVIDWISKYIQIAVEWIKNNERIQKVVNNIKDAFSKAGQSFQIWVKGLKETDNIPEYLFGGLINGINEYAPKVWDAIKNLAIGLIDTFKEMLGIHSPSKVFFAIGGFIIAGLVSGIASGEYEIKDVLNGIVNYIVNFFKGINLGNLIAAGLVGGIAYITGKILLSVNNLINGIANVSNAIAYAVNQFGLMLEDIGHGIKNFGRGIKYAAMAEIIQGIAILIAAIVASIVVLGKLPENELVQGAIAIGVISAALVGIVYAFYKMSDKLSGINLPNLGQMLLIMGTIVLSISTVTRSVAKLSRLQPDRMWSAVVAMTLLLTALGGMLFAMTEMSKHLNTKQTVYLKNLSKVLLEISGSLLILSIALKVMNGVEWSAISKMTVVMLEMVVLLSAIALLNKFSGNSVERASKTLLAVSGCLILLSIAMKVAGKLKKADFSNAVIVIEMFMGIVVQLLLINKLFKGTEMVKVSGSILAVATAIGMLALVVKIAGSISPEELLKGVILVSALGILVGSLIVVAKKIETNQKELLGLGTTLLGVALVLATMAAAVMILGHLDVKALAKGIMAVGFLTAFAAALVIASKNFQANKRAMLALMGITAIIAVLAAITVAFSFIEIQKLIPAVSAVDTMILSLAMLIKSLNNLHIKAGAASALILITIIIGTLAIIVGTLANMTDPMNALASAASLSLLLLACATVLKVLSAISIDAKNAAKGLVALTAMAIPLLAFVGVLSTLSNIDSTNIIPNVLALTILAGAMTGLLVVLSLISNFGVKNIIVGVLGLTAMAVPLYAFVSILSTMQNVKNAMNNVLALTVLASAMTLLLIPLMVIGAICTTGVGALAIVAGILALTGMAVPLLAFVGVLSLMNNVQNATTNVKLLTKMMEQLTECLFKIAVVAPLALLADVAIYGLIGAITSIGIFATAVGAIVEAIPDLKKFLDKGLPILEQIALGIGKIIGNVVAEFIDSIANILPNLGKCLSDFSNNASSFFDKISSLNGDAIANNTGAIASAILSLCGAQLISGITSLLNNGKSFAELGNQLSDFADKAIPALTEMSKIPSSAIDGVKHLAESILILTGANLVEAIGNFVLGSNKDLSHFGDDFTALGKGVKGFNDALGNGINTDNITAGAEAVKSLAEAAEALPAEGGWVDAIIGKTDIESFKEKFPALAEGIAEFASKLGEGFNGKAAKDGADAIKNIADACEHLPKIRGLAQAFTGETDIDFIKKLFIALAESVLTVALIAEEASPEDINKATSMLNSVAELAKNGAFDSNGKKLEEFSACFSSFANKMSEAIKTLTSIDADEAAKQMTKVSSFGETAKNIGDIDQTKLESFAENFKNLGSVGVDAFENSISGDSAIQKMKDAISKAIEALKNAVNDNKDALKDKFNEIGDKAYDGLNWDSTKNNYRYFSFYDLGKNFVEGFANGINDTIDEATTAARKLGTDSVNATQGSIDSHSPSKATLKLGQYFGEGFVIGMNEYAVKAEKAATNIGDYATTGLQDAISKVYDVVNSDIDTQPTIRPVLDLTDIEAGASTLNSMLDMNTMMLNANLGSISTGINRRLQNGSNNDLLMAIKDLGKSISGSTGDTYNVNGVTYNDDADVADAIRTLVNAAVVERRT